MGSASRLKQVFLMWMICTLPACSSVEAGSEDHPSSANSVAPLVDPQEFKARVAALERGMSIEEVMRILGKPRMDTNLGDGQRILSFARIYEGGRIRTIALSFQDGELSDIPSAR